MKAATRMAVRAEAQHLQSFPFNRLSFHRVDNAARTVWNIPSPDTSEAGIRAGEAMAAEMFGALAATRDLGLPQRMFGYLCIQIARRAPGSVVIGFSRGIDRGLDDCPTLDAWQEAA